MLQTKRFALLKTEYYEKDYPIYKFHGLFDSEPLAIQDLNMSEVGEYVIVEVKGIYTRSSTIITKEIK